MDINDREAPDVLAYLEKVTEELLPRLAALIDVGSPDFVSRQQYRVLAEIDQKVTLTIGELGRAIRSAQSTTSEIATRLVKSGLVEKRRGPGSGNLDGRIATVEVSETGRKLCREYRERAHERCRSIVGRVSVEEQAMLSHALRQVNELIRKGTE